jgi:hypothetical protein
MWPIVRDRSGILVDVDAKTISTLFAKTTSTLFGFLALRSTAAGIHDIATFVRTMASTSFSSTSASTSAITSSTHTIAILYVRADHFIIFVALLLILGRNLRQCCTNIIQSIYSCLHLLHQAPLCP